MKSFWFKVFAPLGMGVAVFVYLCLSPTELHARAIRTIEIDPDKVASIQTALGYSTIIEFPYKPTSAVLGDQDAFKLEYVGKSITVKPLIPGAKSNLFVYTEHGRFNCTLRTVSASEVDYLVKVVHKIPVQAMADGPQASKTKRKIIRVDRRQVRSGFGLRVLNYAKLFDVENVERALEIKFELYSKRHAYDFSGKSIGLRQGNEFLNIESLFLSHARVAPGEPVVQGKILVLSTLVSRKKPLQLVFAVPSDVKGTDRSQKHVLRLAVNIFGGAVPKGTK